MSKPRSRANGEGSIFKRTRNGKVAWYAELVTGWTAEGKKQVLRSPGCDKREQASAWLTERLSERGKGTLTVPAKETVGAFIEKWLEETAPMHVGPSTLRLYRNMLDWYISPALGSVQLSQLRPELIQSMFRQMMKDGKKPRTVQLARGVLRRSLQQAVEWGRLSQNPVDLAKAPRVEETEMQVLEPEQIVQFLEAAKAERLHALFTLAVLTGLRKGELLGLRWRDIDLAAGKLTVAQTIKVVLEKDEETGRRKERWIFGQTKTKASKRTITIPVVALAALKRWKAEQNQERLRVGSAWANPELVYTSQVGTPVHPKNMRDRPFKRVLKRAGLPQIRFHDLRHSFATLLAIQGVSDLVMQKVMGHSNINITKTLYGHVLERQKEEAAQKVDAFLAAPDKKAR